MNVGGKPNALSFCYVRGPSNVRAYTRRGRIWNKAIQDKVRVTSVMDKMREARLRQLQAYEEKMRKCYDEDVREVGYTGYKERQKETEKVLGVNMAHLALIKDITLDRKVDDLGRKFVGSRAF